MHTELSKIMTENIRVMGRLSDRIHNMSSIFEKYSKQQVSILMRLYFSGKSKLKDISAREYISTANLCTMFRKLEQMDLVQRTIDEQDRRDTWYSVTDMGKQIAESVLNQFILSVENLFKGLSKQDEKLLIDATKTINNILKRVENA